MNYVKTIFDGIFSFTTFMLFFLAAFMYVAMTSIDKSQAEDAYCIKNGMIKVRTDAGGYCADPVNLVEIK